MYCVYILLYVIIFKYNYIYYILYIGPFLITLTHANTEIPCSH